MSVPPDQMDSLLNNSLYSPMMGLAAGLLQASGPSRMPVSLGQAFGSGMGLAQQYQRAGIQNQLALLPLMQQKMIMDYYKNQGQSAQQPASSQQPAQQAPVASQNDGSFSSNPFMSQNFDSNAFTGGLMGATPSTTDAATGNPSAPQPSASQVPVSAPEGIPIGITDPMQDPQYRNLSMWASMTRSPQMQAQAAQRFQLLTEYNPQLQGQIQYQKSAAQMPFQVLSDAMRYNLRPTVKTPTESIYMPINDPSNPLSQVFKAAAARAGYGAYPQSTQPQGSNQGTPIGGFSSTASTGGLGGSPWIAGLNPGVNTGLESVGKNATEQMTNAIQEAEGARAQIPQLADLSASLDQLNTGPGKDVQIKLKSILGSIQHGLGFSIPFKGDISNSAIANKSILGFVAANTRAMGAREPVQMFKFMQQQQASIGNTPLANQTIVGVTRGMAEYKVAMGKYAQDWQDKYGSGYIPNKGTTVGSWQKVADPMAFVWNNLPEEEQILVIKAAQNNKTLAYELQRAQKSEAALKQMGYLEVQ